jgi:hypothetical protein
VRFVFRSLRSLSHIPCNESCTGCLVSDHGVTVIDSRVLDNPLRSHYSRDVRKTVSPHGTAYVDFCTSIALLSSYSHSIVAYIYTATHQFGEHASPAPSLEQPAGHGARESNCQSNRPSVSERNTSVRIAVLGSTIPLLSNSSLLLMLICGHPASIKVSLLVAYTYSLKPAQRIALAHIGHASAVV